MEMHFTQRDIAQVAAQLCKLKPSYKIFTFVGPLGAGKTTLIKEILRQSGVKELITSPTFSYVNTYHNAAKETFYHFDLYRIDSLESFIAAGFDEYLQQENAWVFIEWPEIIESLLQSIDQLCNITLSYTEDNLSKRKLSIVDHENKIL